MLKKIIKKSERGQAIVLIALALVSLIVIVGLMVDGGVLFIQYSRLKRGVDAAAVSAALSYRKKTTIDELRDTAEEFLYLNQSDIVPGSAKVEICDVLIYYDNNGALITPHPAGFDPLLCTDVPRKLVRVTATLHVQFGFLRLIGWNETDITASSIGEAASVDMVLVIDTSSSMAYFTDGAPGQSVNDNPATCNAAKNCQPMQEIKDILNNPGGDDLIDSLYFPYDRVAIVTSTGEMVDHDSDSSTPKIESRNPVTRLPLSSNEALVRAAIDNIKVFEPPLCDTPYGECSAFHLGGTTSCPVFQNNWGNESADPSSCKSSNVGGAMRLAGDAFNGDTTATPPIPLRQESLWAVIALFGGPANATDKANDSFTPAGHNIFGHCPQSTWPFNALNPTKGLPDPEQRNPNCRDASATTRHCADYLGAPHDSPPIPADPNMLVRCKDAGGVYNPLHLGDPTDPNYDADDFARDWADWVADPVDGQGATIFTIGYSDDVIQTNVGDPAAGEKLLKYMALEAGDHNNHGSTPEIVNHGKYFYSANTTNLPGIFDEIAANIFTRISH